MSAAPALQLRTEAFVGGAFAPAASGRTLPTLNPATGEVLADVAACDAQDVDRAVAAARAAFEAGVWSRRSPAERKAVLLRFADLVESHRDEIAWLDCLEAGKPITDCREIDLEETLTTFRWFAEAADKLYDEVAPAGHAALGVILREPIGVVGAVLPWNFPALMLAWKAAPALAAGNSLIVKPAEQTSLSALRLAELAAEAGVPDGVFQVVPGDGPEAGEALGMHPGVDMISFTGSTEIGRRFLEYSARSNLKEVVLECGGKSPQVVLADAPDLDEVVEQVLVAAFWNMGENCACGSRLIVDERVHDALIERLVVATERLAVGDPADAATRLGPLIEQAHLDKVLGYVASGREQGARLLTGGERVLASTGGYFLSPAIFDGARNDMRIAREEIFGPVLTTISFETEAEAIALANDTSYGLAASLYTRDLDAAMRVGRAIRAGTVSLNCYSEGDVSTPFGGYGQSGFGGRDKSVHAFDQYTELKTLWLTQGGLR